LVGPTASGKSELALGVAGALGDVEIISADSMQVYRGMDVGTAKPPAEARRLVAHHLVDVADPSEDWGLSRFLACARAAVEQVEARGHRPLLVGGTGLYVHALVDGFEVPGRWPAVAAELEECGTDDLYRRLCELDPAAAAKVDPGNRRRLVRALEVVLGSGRPFSSFGPGVGAFPPTSWSLAGVWLPRSLVNERAAKRLENMLRAGLVEEVRALAQRGMSLTARQALGYKEILEHTEGGAPLEAAIGKALRRTREFARRQRMWWRRDPRVRWFGSARDPKEVLPALLANWANG
jgi:tRNA dimethylallyltransferase